METHINSFEQQRQAKLNLLLLDDYNHNEDQRDDIQEDGNWGRSLQTQSFLRQKLSQRYKTKRKSYRQLRSRSTVNKQCKLKKPFVNDKQSLKQLLRKLESKQLKPSNMQTLRNSMLVEFKKGSKYQTNPFKNQSNRSTIQHRNVDNRSLRKGIQQTLQNGQNNFISKKIDFLNNKKGCLQENSVLYPIEGMMRRQFLTQTKQQKRALKSIFRKNTQNKENQVVGILQFPLDPYKNGELIRNSILISKNDKNRNILIQKEQINKRTFQILQQINRTKSISNVKKLTSQSLKLKKPQLCAYSKILKDRNNKVEQKNVGRNNILIKSNQDNIWVKLQIRK